MRIIDISVPIHNNMPVWPTSIGVRVTQTMHRALGAAANASRLDCDVHTGTHVDAPRHFIEEGKGVDALDLKVLCGQCCVAEATGIEVITRSVLEKLALPAGTRRLLLRTNNSRWWAQEEAVFHQDYVALTAGAAKWIVDRGIELIGVDYLSVQRFTEGSMTHEILLSNEVVIVEGLDLSKVKSGKYELVCLPLCIIGADGAPARAVLRSDIEDEARGNRETY